MSEVLFSASAVRPASDAEDSTAGQTAGMQGSKSLPWVLPYVHGQQAVHMESFTGTIAAFTGNSANRI